MKPLRVSIIAAFYPILYLLGCAPTVKVEAPDKPIEINMNVKIEHEIRLRVERDVDELITQNKGLF